MKIKKKQILKKILKIKLKEIKIKNSLKLILIKLMIKRE